MSLYLFLCPGPQKSCNLDNVYDWSRYTLTPDTFKFPNQGHCFWQFPVHDPELISQIFNRPPVWL